MLHLYIYIYISYIILWRYNCRNNLTRKYRRGRPIAFEDFHWKQKVGFFLDLAQVRSKEPGGKVWKNAISFQIWQFLCIYDRFQGGIITLNQSSPSQLDFLQIKDQSG